VVATIRDVARRAGVGVGTVSRVLNGSPSVSGDTRRRVQCAIDELHFVPNLSARRLSTGRTGEIAVIAPFFTRPAFIERLRGVQERLLESAYDLNLYNVETPRRRDQCLREAPRARRADGVIILSLPPRDDDLPYLAQAETPIVLVDANHPSLSALNRIIVDDVCGGRAAAQHLIDLGHRRIAFLSDWLDSPFNFTSSRDRYLGYCRALKEAGADVRPEYFTQGEHSLSEARRSTLALLGLPLPPTAIFAASDDQALGVLEAARDAGLRVPADLSVIGYDDIEIAAYVGLTTIRQQLYESGRRGVELLLEMLQGKRTEVVCEILPTELIVRSTTAPPAS
jgi:DNA-binding LacI/PurR family transcriptional regulator